MNAIISSDIIKAFDWFSDTSTPSERDLNHLIINTIIDDLKLLYHPILRSINKYSKLFKEFIMSEQFQTKFRSTYGLDAAGNKVINVADADKTILTDGVNVAFLRQENTIQHYDPTRGYDKSFAVIYQERIWISQVDIAKPAGTFKEGQWRATRTDPKWIPISSGVRPLKSGEYITVDTSAGLPIEFTLPSDALDGDTITLKEVGGRPGFVDVVIKAGLQSILLDNIKLKETKITVPFSQYMFVYVNKLWNLYLTEAYQHATHVDTTSTFDIQSGATVIRQYNALKPIKIKFPKNANNGDMIHFAGTDRGSIPYYNLELSTFDASSSILIPGTKATTLKRSLSGYFVYNALTTTWMLYDSDITNRLRTVGSNTLLFPHETVSVVGSSNTVASTIDLTLPTDVEPGDQITVALNYMRKLQTVNIVTTGNDKILSNMNLLQFPKRSTYPPEGNWVSTNKLTFNGTADYPPIITFAYVDMGPVKHWLVVENSPLVERVDPLSPDRLGVIALATQAQANIDKGAIALESKELAITPETLANRTATETRQGIAAISTSEQATQITTAAHDDLTFITPKKLNERTATETRRGLAEIATQDETNAGTDDITIVTPKKLDAKRATESMAGSAMLVVKNATEGSARDTAGSGIYNFNDQLRIVTPLTLNEYKSSEKSQGSVFLATLSEVIDGAVAPSKMPIVVTPEMLHKKTAMESRIGLTQIATQDETNSSTDDFKYLTPKKLAGRAATDVMTGVIRTATQAEFDAGASNTVAASPLKIKTFFNSTNRAGVNASSGLTIDGTIWSKLNLDILSASESQRGTTTIATTPQVTAGTDDTTFVTPKKLQEKKATENVYGITKIATFAETNSGDSKLIAVSPASLLNAITVEAIWQATTTRRGPVELSDGAITFVGNNKDGNTQNLDLYLKAGYAVSPYELNKTLGNFLPLKAKANDSDKLDGLDSLQFIRRDITQTVEGALSLTQSLATKDVSTDGVIKVGVGTDGVKGTPKIRLQLKSPVSSGSWNHSTVDSVSNNSEYSIGHEGSKSITLSSNDTLTVHSASVFESPVTFNSSITTNGAVNTKVGYQIDSLPVFVKNGTNSYFVGNTTKLLSVFSSDSANIISNDGSNYKFLTEKNMKAILNPIYANLAGDTFSGRVNINAPSTNTIAQTIAAVKLISSANNNNFGTWVSEITTESLYKQLPGYVVGVPEMNLETGLPTGFISHYDEFDGPGTLSQFGSSSTNGSGTYQIWAPRPKTVQDKHIAGTFHMRSWNSAKGDFDGWGRLFTTNNPPTASDIGAMANNGSVFDSLRIRDWIQIGNIRISADRVNKTVKFDWVD